MTARQPQTPQEAALLDPLGLMSVPQPSSGGLFGSGRRRRKPFQIGDGSMNYGADPTAPGMDMASPPPISMAPPPPSNWQQVVGPDALAAATATLRGGQSQTPLQVDTLPPSPPRRRTGMFGSVAQAPQGELPPTIGGQPATVPIGADLPQGASQMADTVGGAAQKKGGFDWHMAAGILGDALLSLNGQAPLYAQNMWRLRQQQQEQNDRLAQMREQTRLKLTEPEYRSINNRLVRFTPGTGQSDVLYTAPQDFEDYAATLGAEPGTPEYDRLVQDYVLRGGGPTATDNYNLREDWRQKNREELEGIRQSNRSALEGQRQAGRRALKATPTYRQANPLPPRSGGRGGASGASVREGQTATGPDGTKATFRNGQWMIQQAGKWVPLK